MHDQTILLNCPYCGRPVRFDRTEGETHLHVCQQCGALALPLDGGLRRVLPSHTLKPQ
jgi:uncharacterized protein YbaR (Trm112 family)